MSMTLNAYSRTTRLLVVDADQNFAKQLCDALFAEGYQTRKRLPVRRRSLWRFLGSRR
jgi:hypothetical protein